MMHNFIHIDDINQNCLHIFANLSEPQLAHIYEPELGLFMAESPNVIERALDAGYIPETMLVEERLIPSFEYIFNRCGDIPIYTASIDVLDTITGFKLTKGLLCAMRRKTTPDYKDLLSSSRRIAILEEIVNPTNIGAIFRSAAALNVDAILLTPGCADPLYRRAARVSMGTVFQIPYTYIFSSFEEWTERGLDTIHELGYHSVAMALKPDSLNIRDNILKSYDKLAILLGSEGPGLSENTLRKCTHTAIIPMSHNVDSLNVAAASAVTFYELCQ